MELSSVEQIDTELNQHIFVAIKQILYFVDRHELSLTRCNIFTDEVVSRVGVLNFH
jgi:hypothetical protein